MAAWGVVFLVALAGITVSADPDGFTYPEVARERSSRIVSGWEAVEGQIPYQLSIRMVSNIGGVNSCGGTILTPEWGMTAAHCTATRPTIVVRAGTVNLTRPEILFETTEYYNHPDYNANIPSVVQPNDIALLRFGRSLTFSDRVSAIRLQRSVDMNRNYAGIRLMASGWGRTWTDGPAPENLNWVYLLGVSNTACLLAFGGSSIIQDSTICAAGYNVTSQSVCQGDSGGPLVVIDVDGQESQVGISSFVSSTGCHTDIPAGFCRPGHYHSWFREVTGINFDWDPEESSETDEESDESVQVPDPDTDEESDESVQVPDPDTDEESDESVQVPDPDTDEESDESVQVPDPDTDEESDESVQVPDPDTDEESGLHAHRLWRSA